MNTKTPTILPARRSASGTAEFPFRDASPAASGNGGRGLGGLTPCELADRLIGAWARNERRLGELDDLDAGIASARRRLATTSVGRALAEARLERLLARRAACVVAIRDDAAMAEEASREWDARHAPRRAVGG